MRNSASIYSMRIVYRCKYDLYEITLYIRANPINRKAKAIGGLRKGRRRTMGGRRYTDEEIARLTKFIKMNPGMNYKDLARNALELGIIKNRGVSSLAQQIGSLAMAKEEPKEGPKEDLKTDVYQIEWDALMSFQYKNELKELEHKYSSLMDILIGKSEVREVTTSTATYRNLYFDFIAINNWIKENEPLLLAEKIEDSEFKEGE